MSAIRLRGATSGTTDVIAAAIAGDGVMTLPTGTGTLATAAYVDAAVAAGGKVLQVVRATDVTMRTTTSTSYVDASISVTITPKKNDSAILLIWSFALRFPSGNYISMQITDSSNNAVSGAEIIEVGTTTALTNPTFIGLCMGYATPETTSSVTYKGRFTVGSGTGQIRNSSQTGQLYAMEIGA